ncbi:hypothetical protein NM688_g1373 [Phlebia brevispora]|uniref:Uncharacterized protein n=1 Tax=Phlebia brevispora TaxID=194682 RepID=A0ACC1TBB6_9APHY|nr:hypothetical protein NM688_g1373 [Phlebia brevispora]
MSHKLPEQYSGKNPVPQIATKLTALVNPERATEAKAAQLQDKSGQRDQKETQKRARGLAKGHVMRVVDPVTGDELEMKNADEEPDLRNKGENILSEEFPPLDWKAHRKRVLSFAAPSIFHIAVVYSICFLFARFTSGKLLSTVIALIFPACLTYALLFRLRSIAQRDFDDRSWESERTRGLRAGSDLNGDGIVDEQERVKESAEWANAVLRGVWPIMNPDLFGNLTDILEDIMQASVPRFVHSVRVSDVGLGSNAARITFIRSLPDSETQKQHEIDECNECAKTKEENGSAKDCHDQTPDKDEDEELNRQHVNLELSFAYRGLPSGQSVHSKARNIHLLVEFFLGIRGWYGFKVPVWVEIDGIVGTARARLHLISDPPFIKTTMITLLGLPRITISVVPLSRLLPNVMDLPFISGFISSSIDTAVAEYVAPKSVTINLQRLIRGDDVKKDTEAIGVIVVHIHRAKGVKKMDTMGSSDPYTTLTYSKLGKPLYSTRIIKDDCNPVFEETAVVLVDVNIIRLHEKLSLRLWDSDRMTVVRIFFSYFRTHPDV